MCGIFISTVLYITIPESHRSASLPAVWYPLHKMIPYLFTRTRKLYPSEFLRNDYFKRTQSNVSATAQHSPRTRSITEAAESNSLLCFSPLCAIVTHAQLNTSVMSLRTSCAAIAATGVIHPSHSHKTKGDHIMNHHTTSRNILSIVQAAMIAALYIVLTALAAGFDLASGAIQVRFSEVLTILPFFTPAASSQTS